jgi:hypothetical protein
MAWPDLAVHHHEDSALALLPITLITGSRLPELLPIIRLSVSGRVPELLSITRSPLSGPPGVVVPRSDGDPLTEPKARDGSLDLHLAADHAKRAPTLAFIPFYAGLRDELKRWIEGERKATGPAAVPIQQPYCSTAAASDSPHAGLRVFMAIAEEAGVEAEFTSQGHARIETTRSYSLSTSADRERAISSLPIDR